MNLILGVLEHEVPHAGAHTHHSSVACVPGRGKNREKGPEPQQQPDAIRMSNDVARDTIAARPNQMRAICGY